MVAVSTYAVLAVFFPHVQIGILFLPHYGLCKFSSGFIGDRVLWFAWLFIGYGLFHV